MPDCRSQPIYLNPTDETQLGYINSGGHYSEHHINDDLVRIPFENALPVRGVPMWKGKNVYKGPYWSSTNRDLVVHESFLGREYLWAADFDQSIVAIQWQPMVLKWPKGTKKNRGHVPHHLVRFASGLGRIADVKTPDKVETSGRQFAMTRKVCDTVCWEYEVFTGPPAVHGQNVSCLTACHQDYW